MKQGDRVRVRTSSQSEPAVGTVQAIDSGHLALVLADRSDSLAIRREAITGLELSQGKRSQVGRGALIGGLAGVVVGFLAPRVVCDDCYEEEGYGEFVAASVALFGVVGTGVGALIGATVRKERWVRVDPLPFQLSTAAYPDQVTVKVKVSF
jgi:hypothetical protein